MSNKTFDEIQKRYHQYKIDSLDGFKTAFIQYCMLFGEFIYVF